MKKYLSLLLLVSVIGCATKTVAPPTPLPEQTPIEIPESSKASYITNSTLPHLKKAVEVANCVLNKKEFQDEVRSVPTFDYSQDNGEQVLSKLLNYSAGYVVKTYVTSWYAPWRCSVLGYTSNKVIYVNTRNCVYPRSLNSLTNTIVHESTHVIGYSHGSNSDAGKEDAVGYKLGEIAEKHSEGCL